MLIRRNILPHAGVMVATIACLAFACIGQKSISKEEVEGYYKKAREICRSTPYRIKITIEQRVTEDGVWQPYSESVMEFAGPNSHFKRKYLETISIGKKFYIKQPDGTWKEKAHKKTNGTVRMVGPAVYEYIREKGGGPSNENTVAFQVESRFKLEYLSDGLIFDHHNTGRVWFDDLGRYLMTESISFEPRRRIFIRRLEEYEYDESIRIEAPETRSNQ